MQQRQSWAAAVGIGVWAVMSIVMLWYLPIGVGVIYVVGCLVAGSWYARRDRNRREREMADSADTRRAGDDADGAGGPSRPSGIGYGRHSWAQPDDPDPPAGR